MQGFDRPNQETEELHAHAQAVVDKQMPPDRFDTRSEKSAKEPAKESIGLQIGGEMGSISKNVGCSTIEVAAPDESVEVRLAEAKRLWAKLSEEGSLQMKRDGRLLD